MEVVLRELCERLHVGVLVHTADTILYANSFFADILNTSPDGIIGAHPRAIAHVMIDQLADRDSVPVEEILGARAASHEVRLNDGRRLVWDFSTAEHDELDTLRFWIITEAPRPFSVSEPGVAQEKTRLPDLSRLIMVMAHEFNNVLMGIQPFTDVINRQSKDEMTQRACNHISLGIRRGRQITEEVLGLARSRPATMTTIDAAVWLHEFAIEAQGLVEPHVNLELTVEERGPLWIAADADQLAQVFSNLVINARDAMPKGGTVRIATSRCYSWSSFHFTQLQGPDRFLHFTVADSGTGIDPTTLQRIFEPLFTTKRHGTGIGLAVVKEIIEHHGGHIFVESRPAVGTMFHIFLPTALPPDLEEPPPAPAELPPSVFALRILLIEDDVPVSTGIAQALRLMGLHVDIIQTGSRAVEAVHRFSPDVVVLDIGLPDISGIEVFRKLRKTAPALPVIFSTGHTDRAEVEPFLSESHVEFLRKPYSTQTLLESLAKVTEYVPPD